MNGNDEGNRIYVTYLCVEVDGVHVRILLKIIPQKTNTFLPILLTSLFFFVSFFVILIHQAPKFHPFFAATQKKGDDFWHSSKSVQKTGNFFASTTTAETRDDLPSGSSPLEEIFPNVPWGIFYPHFTYLRFIYKIYVKWFIHGAYGMKILLKWWIFLQVRCISYPAFIYFY